MASARYVVLGLAPARSAWFRDVARWSTAGAAPIEFVKCLSSEEVQARLSQSRPFSALLVDALAPGLDRDLIDAAGARGCPVLIVGASRSGRDWTALGAAATVTLSTRRDLIDALAVTAAPIERPDRLSPTAPAVGRRWQAPLVVVTGPGGTGASTIAIAVAQGCGGDIRLGRDLVLADLCRHGDQAMLHDAHHLTPSIQELVDAYRSGEPDPGEVRRHSFAVAERKYRLLLGLRRSRAWGTIGPRAFDAALSGLRGAHRFVVADVDADLEGEADGGSVDVEERNAMARSACAAADVAVVVGGPGMKGLHSLQRVVVELADHGVEAARVLPVINRAPRGRRAGAEVVAAFARLLPPEHAAVMISPLLIPERNVDAALRDGVALPRAVAQPVAAAVGVVLERAGRNSDDRDTPDLELVVPGSLGVWTAELAGEAD